LCSDLVGHFEKRHSDVIGHYDPARLDRAQLATLIERYGADEVRARSGDLDAALHMLSEPDEDPALLDEFAPSGLRSPADIRATFARQCFFGCEADDPTWALAFAPEYHGTRLGAMFASDLGHWDVPDATGVLPEAWELVERGLVDVDAFRAFTHDHALELWGPRLFADTVVAQR
jgi:hypothetical protein